MTVFMYKNLLKFLIYFNLIDNKIEIDKNNWYYVKISDYINMRNLINCY